MKKPRDFATNKPIIFALALILMYALLMTLTFPVHFLFPENDTGQLFGDAASKFITFLGFLGILRLFGWLDLSGINRLGKVKYIPLVTLTLVYLTLAKVYAFTGNLRFTISDTNLAAANVAYAFSTSLVEETMTRGLILIALMLAWGKTKRGQFLAILVSSALWASLHLFNILVRPADVVLMQALILTIPGIFYAALVLSSRSLWPAILIHWFGNAAVNIALIGVENYPETITMWIVFLVSLIPILITSLFLMRRLPGTENIYTTEFDQSMVPSGNAALD